MIWVLGIEWALTLLGCLTFLVMFFPDGRRSEMGRHIIAFSSALAIETTLFLLSLIRVLGVPVWLFAVSFGLTALVVYQRIWLFLRIRNEVSADG